METKTEIVICPRCKVNKLNPHLPANALSRVDNKTYICSDCGVEEAMDDFFGYFPKINWLEDKKCLILAK